MKKFRISYVLMALLISGALIGTAFTSATKTKQMDSSETRQVSGFSGIASSGNFNVKVTMGTTESLKIVADKELLEDIETTVEKNVLTLRHKNHNFGSRRSNATIYITAKKLNNISVSGSGTIDIAGTLKTSHLNNAVSGSGSINLITETSDYTAAISGSGKINISGGAKTAQINVSGSGEFNGKNLNTDDSDLKISGSGSVLITANKTLDAALSGSGKIRYSGNARVTQTKSGSGSIAKL